MRASDEEIDVWRRIGLRTVGRLYWGAVRLRYAGLARIPRQGSAIFAMNHVSVLDPIALALATASRGRAIRFLAGAEFFEHPVWGPGLRVTGQIPVRRGIRDLAALDELIAELRRGGLAGIFPDGTVGALSVLEQSDDGPRHRAERGVQRVDRTVTIRRPHAAFQPPGMEVRCVRTRRELPVTPLPRKPRLDVVLLRRGRTELGHA